MAAILYSWLSYPVAYARLKMYGEPISGKIESIDTRHVPTVSGGSSRLLHPGAPESLPCLSISYERDSKKRRLTSCSLLLNGRKEGEHISLLVDKDDPDDAVIDDQDMAVKDTLTLFAGLTITAIVAWRMLRRREES
jgi:hypothetical protein